MRTALYRHFDAAGQLLYVGISLSAVQRLAQHKQTARWFTNLARIDIEWFPNRRLAEQAERAAIWHESPRFNLDRPVCEPLPAPVWRPEFRVWDVDPRFPF